MDNDRKNKLFEIIKKAYNKSIVIDNKFPTNINSLQKSREVVSKQLKKISEYEIVITDRLHGMIFCAITETSCIAIRNYNHKLTSSYEWFKHLDYIKLINDSDINTIENLFYYFKNKKTRNTYNKQYFKRYYNLIRDAILI